MLGCIMFGPFCSFALLFMLHLTCTLVINFLFAAPCASRLAVLFSVLKYLFERDCFEKVKTIQYLCLGGRFSIITRKKGFIFIMF